MFFLGGAFFAALSLLFTPRDTEECAVLRRTLLAQQAMDPHREGPIDFSYVSLELVASCGAEAMRMPQPYKIRIESTKTEAQLQHEFFALKKPTVRVRDIHPFNKSVEKLLTGTFGSFTDNHERQLLFPEAHACLKDGTCALFFDNTWTYDDIKPMVPTTPGGSLESLLNHTRFGNMFCTNLSQSRKTARLHSAVFHGSIAVQLAGIKRWKFWNPSALDERGFQSDESSFGRLLGSFIQPFAGMNEVMNNVPHYDVVTIPGDFLYFPSHWTHVVWTDAGWNNMINLRMAFTARTVFQSLLNARKLHTVKGAARLFFANTVMYLVKDKVFKQFVERSRDKSKEDVGDGITAEYLDDFVRLNLKVM